MDGTLECDMAMSHEAKQVRFIVYKPRLRHHHKSRAGCLNCKRRRVKVSHEQPWTMASLLT